MSFLLDTNVVSEIRRRQPDTNVRQWLSGVPNGSLFLSVLVIGELRVGVERLRNREATRASELDLWLTSLVDEYRDRVLHIDLATADRCGALQAAHSPLPAVDALLAATALTHDLTVATRNVRDFERTGVPVVNPWSSGA